MPWLDVPRHQRHGGVWRLGRPNPDGEERESYSSQSDRVLIKQNKSLQSSLISLYFPSKAADFCVIFQSGCFFVCVHFQSGSYFQTNVFVC